MGSARPPKRSWFARLLRRTARFGLLGLAVGALAGSAAALYFQVSYGRPSLALLGAGLSWSETVLIALVLGLVGSVGGLVTRNERDAIVGLIIAAALTLGVALSVTFDTVPQAAVLFTFLVVVGGGLGFITGRGPVNRVACAAVGAGAALGAQAAWSDVLALFTALVHMDRFTQMGPALVMGAAMGGFFGLVIWAAIGLVLPLFRARPTPPA